MREVGIGIVGLGNVGSGTLAILAENGREIARKLGFPLRVVGVCSRSPEGKHLPAAFDGVWRTANWRELVAHPEVDVVAELVGGCGVAHEILEGAIAAGKSVVTANKELMALEGPSIWTRAARAGVNLAMEASVAGGIPIHAVLREGIAGDWIQELSGILNGTCNYILTEIEKHGTPFETVLAEAQRLGYAEADPSADVDGLDARSKLALLGSLAFGVEIRPEAVYVEGIRRISPMDFQYARQLNHTIRLIGAAERRDDGILLSVRPALIPTTALLSHVNGAYNAVWVKGRYGSDTLYYGRGAGPEPTGVAVVSDLMRVARDLQCGGPSRVAAFGFSRVGTGAPISILEKQAAYYLRFRVKDRPGIIAALASILAEKKISLEAVLQEPCDTKHDLPFVITVEPTSERSIQEAVARMATLDFQVEPPLALPIEPLQ
ncbi:MAG: homoserine dehydrogenase [Bryobacterales bacterium]|nr:homoserine dehydrogenase [Bryobacterales bacterium]